MVNKIKAIEKTFKAKCVKQSSPEKEKINSLVLAFHKYIVRQIGKKSTRKIEKVIMSLIDGNPKKIIDVSCGDDTLLINLKDKYRPEVCVANDIVPIKKKEKGIIYTSHNLLNFSLNEKFDLMLFKNTLHHIPFKEQISLIKKLSKITKQLILVDIDNPRKSSFRSKIWHWYYTYLLGDKGYYFSKYTKLKKKLEEIFKEEELDFGLINTIKGDFFYCSVTKVTEKKEIEIKLRVDPHKVNDIKNKIIKLGGKLVQNSKEVDTYFSAFHRDFMKTMECLRIRENEGFVEFTYKGASTKEMKKKKQSWKKETNIPLTISKEDAEMFLCSLGCKRLVKVIKNRAKYELGKHQVTIDTIKGVGIFSEIEVLTDDEDIDKILKENLALAKKIGLNEKDIVNEPYRDIVLKAQRNKYG